MTVFRVTSGFLFVSKSRAKDGHLQRLLCAETLERAVELYEEAVQFSGETLLSVSKVDAEVFLERPENA